MNYLYHLVPKEMKGNILYPLNTLKERYPKIYQEQINKYIGREEVTQRIIPKWNCLWNDVLHFTAINPKEKKKAFIEAGLDPKFTADYYQIDPNLLDPRDTIVYLYNYKRRKDIMSDENFVAYNPNEIKKISALPQETIDYYKEAISKKEKLIPYHRTPHILYKGTLDTTNISIITV